MEERHQQQETMRRENRRVQAMSWGKCNLPKGIQNLNWIIRRGMHIGYWWESQKERDC
jgi:hypothetical protein